MNDRKLSYLAYADLIVLLAHNCDELKGMAEDLAEVPDRVGLEISYAKTKWMRLGRPTPDTKEVVTTMNRGRVRHRIYSLGTALIKHAQCTKRDSEKNPIQTARKAYFKYRIVPAF